MHVQLSIKSEVRRSVFTCKIYIYDIIYRPTHIKNTKFIHYQTFSIVFYADMNECEQKDAYGLIKSPCNLEHSSCENKDPFFQCKCDNPWIPDEDGLGCSSRDLLVVEIHMDTYK